MSFSQTVVYDYAAIEKKTKNFASPSFEIKVGGQTLKPEEYPVTSVEVNIPVMAGTDKKTIESGQCTFTIVGLFDAKKSEMKVSLDDVFKVGKTLTVSMGYITRIEVFKGFICQMSVQYQADGPVVQVSALDASYILRGAFQSKTFKENQAPTQSVKDMLTKATASGMAKIKELSIVESLNISLHQINMDDCTLLTILARRNGYTFAFVHGDILFCDLLTKLVSPVIELKWGTSLMSFQKELNTNRQVGHVVITGEGPDIKKIKGEARSVTVGGSGKTAAQLDTNIGNKKYELEEQILNNPKALNKLAQVTLNNIAMRFVSGKGSCIGLPELIPGRFIKLGGMGKSMDGEYFLTRVVHRIDANGFLTTFEVKGAKS